MDRFRVVRVGTLLFAMFTIGWLAVFSRHPDALASEMWPIGLAAAAVFTARRRQVPVVLLLVLVLAFGTFLLGGRPLNLAAGGAIGVVLEAVVIAWVLTDRGRRRPGLRNDADLARFLVAIALGALAAALVSMLSLGNLDPESLRVISLGTLAGHASSALFLLPFFMETHEHGAVARRVERSVQWLMTAAVTSAVFLPHEYPAPLFLVMPFLAWGARRLSLAEVQWQLVMVATIGTVLTTFGFGPLAEVPSAYAVPYDSTGILLQVFLLACGLVATPFAVIAGKQVLHARQLRVERDKVQQIVNSANVAIIGTDRDGRIELFNPGAERLLGYDREEVLGRHMSMFHTPDQVARKAAELEVPNAFAQVALKLAEPDTGAMDVELVRKDGVARTHSMTLSRIVDERGRVIGYVSTSEDVTERVLAHQTLIDALETERRAVERLKEVDQVKETFVSAVSHELRTPITSIVGFLEMLEDGTYGDLNRQQADAVDRVNTNSRRLLSLIDELLTLSRVQDDGLGLDDREIDLRDVVRTAYDVVAPAWSLRDLTVRLELPEEAVPYLGDEDMLERVVVNLVSNAVKFTPPGGRVAVSLARADGEALIEVSDTGIGIPVEEQELLFTRFFRSSNAQERAIPGSGLGLSIARAIVEMHGGVVDVESEPGDGTTFRVRLPVAVEEPV